MSLSCSAGTAGVPQFFERRVERPWIWHSFILDGCLSHRESYDGNTAWPSHSGRGVTTYHRPTSGTEHCQGKLHVGP